MKKIIFTYGTIAGVVIIGSLLIGLYLASGQDSFAASELLGYLIMIVALSMIFVGIKRYRDQELGGVIHFGRAFALGLGISVVASVVYVAAWEVNLALTDYAFYEEWPRAEIAKKEAAGMTGAELEAFSAEVMQYAEMADKPLLRMAITLLEILPVGLLVALISAAILRKSNILPAEA